MNDVAAEQAAIRCVILRGGSSRGLYFHKADLPEAGAVRDRLIERLIGAPDEVEIDGLGGSRPITSKIAIVSKSARDDADVDYTFGQVEIDRAGIVYTGNCGNISSGVGPFAIDERLVEVTEGQTRVRIFNTNTKKLIVADVPVKDGKAKVEGDFTISGVPGTGARIFMNWSATVGAATGKLLPTGNAVDSIALENGKKIDATLCDAANACVWVRASDFGIDGSELIDEINQNTQLIATAKEARGKAAVLFGLCKDWQKVDEESPGLPMIGFIATPKDYKTINGATVLAKDMDFRIRLLFMNRLHESIAGTGSICLAAASRVKGSVPESLSAKRSDKELLMGTPSGITQTDVVSRVTETSPFVAFDRLSFDRTARRLMDSNAYYPVSVIAELASSGASSSKPKIPGVVHEE